MKFFSALAPLAIYDIVFCSIADFFVISSDIYKYFELKYNNVETFCEKKLEELTAETVLQYTHDPSRLSDCWIKECKDCCLECVYRTSKAKKEYVLRKGPATYLLTLE